MHTHGQLAQGRAHQVSSCEGADRAEEGGKGQHCCQASREDEPLPCIQHGRHILCGHCSLLVPRQILVVLIHLEQTCADFSLPCSCSLLGITA